LRHRETFRDNYLLPSIQEGLVEMTIPDKPKSPNQKYRR
ncbi:MAG: Fic family protein, partial [Bacteroidota bacterium]